ncbi:class I ribonucleotide reductase maintenance protein YfaE [Psychromonas sp. Urea-02u-13]|uniref:class I ribonucleotide reductase maintenance protein YfaE n=1 Tax=Psychromonas sp. Urea-02u-13 TaxID=2058326 RepID=UPI000C342495|nr:class I ribonucleotide reductase maintenance protein YfaE [Psychromonas sp. Urea-02u-13]PKG40425.1 ferredoxin [Psychromonas sp. Urea-02u-13]
MANTLTVDGIEYPLDTQKTLLENLESHAIKVEFHCRDGHCGACRCALLEGGVEYVTYPMAYVRDNEILTCCSKSSQNIKIATY